MGQILPKGCRFPTPANHSVALCVRASAIYLENQFLHLTQAYITGLSFVYEGSIRSLSNQCNGVCTLGTLEIINA